MFEVLNDILAEPWFWPAISVIVGLPIALLMLGEVHTAMVRRGTAGAHIVLMVRNVLVPLGAIIILFTQIPQEAGNEEFTWPKVAATAFGFVLILVLLNGLNLAIFVTAKQGTWRRRIPSIFVDIARVLLIVVCLAVLFGWIWNADIGGFFTALGIGSIVIGLALQNAVGSIVSGLFLLFEQTVRDRRLRLDPRRQGAGRGGQLARDSHRHLQRHPGHPELDTGGRVVPQPQPRDLALRGRRPRCASRRTIRRRRSSTCSSRSRGGLPERHPDENPTRSR